MSRKIRSFDDFLALFPKCPRKKIPNGWNVICPAHSDRKPSLSVTLKESTILVKCRAGCKTEDVVKLKGLTLADLFLNSYKPKPDKRTPKKLVETFPYQDATGVERYQIRRFEPKDFQVWHKNKSGEYVPGLGETKPIPYRLPELLQAIKYGKTVYLPEGEGKVNRLEEIGLTATTSPLGAGPGKWLPEYNPFFTGGDLVILADNDDVGQAFAQEKAQNLITVAKRVKVLLLPNLPPKGDVIDWLDKGHTVDELRQLVDACPDYEPTPDGRCVRQDCQNQQETQDKPQEEIQPYNREQYLKVLSQWLYLEDQQDIDIIMATAISICLPGDPIWMFIITAAGGSKTEILRTFSNNRTFSTSTLTPQTLISGLKGGKDIDLMPKLDGKLLIIKDFTSILSKKAEDQAGIFADLREAYDGYLEKSFGSGVGTKRYKSSFGVLAGVTDAIDMYRVVHALLGERFLKCRLHTNPKEAIERASNLAGKEVEMRAALTEATNSCMAYYAEKASQYEAVIVEKQTHHKITALADLTAKLRSEVARDRFHKVLYQPQPEIGTRLAKQLRKLAQALSVFYEHDCIGDAEYNVLLRIAQDTVPKQRMKLVLGMMDAEPLTTKVAGDRAEIPTETAKEILEDLWMLKLIARTGDSTFYWQLTDSMNYLLLDSGLGTQNTLRTHKSNNNSFG